ncbi:MAG: HD domain-containing protein [Clostridium sp.]|nr:HD domain-containing protein [Clostridium sp.]MCM1172256.1 HD domain-containing protein [Clostridium sp.]MCM1209498.1 HD domain-containing protein [Ruminococcus sp.]
MLFIKAEDLKYGMRLAKPIYNKTGVLLYERNTGLTMQGIESVKNFGLLGLYILEPAEPVPPMTDEDLDFERFQTMAVFSIREELDSLIAGREPKNLKRLSHAIITNYGRLDHKISFTQNLRSTTDYVYKHVINTAILSALISSHAGIGPNEQEELVLAALLHDTGKLLLPSRVRDKYDDYDANDMVMVRKFQADGLGLIRPELGLNSGVKRVVAQMHRMEYGSDEGDEGKILKTTKVLKVANLFDTMTCMKLNSESISEIAAIKHLLKNQKEYGSEIVGALVKSINILTPGVCIELTNKEKGLVITENTDNILRPMVLGFTTNKIYDLSNDSVYKKYKIVDIMKTMDNRIKVDNERLEEYRNRGDNAFTDRRRG